MSIPISTGSGAASVAAEAVSGLQYQQIQVLGGGGASILGINPDRSINVSVIGAINITGSVTALGTVGASIIGWVPIQASNTSIIAVIQGSVAAVTTAAANQSVSGTVGASIVGQLPAGTAVLGSIAVYQGPAAWVTSDVKAEDTTHTSGDAGSFSLGVRNDTLASVTSADNEYAPFTLGPVGEQITANAPLTKWIQGVADLQVVLGASVTAIAAQGASIFTYITGIQVANFGPSSVLVKFGGGLGSTLGWTIAPAGGGSNIVYRNALKTGANSAFTASINGVASVLVSAQGFIAKI